MRAPCAPGEWNVKRPLVEIAEAPLSCPCRGMDGGLVGINNLGSARSDSVLDYPSVLTRAAAIRDWVYEHTGGDPYALPSVVEGVGGIVSGLLTKEGVKNAASFAPGAAPESIVEFVRHAVGPEYGCRARASAAAQAGRHQDRNHRPFGDGLSGPTVLCRPGASQFPDAG